jgi:hypothetical protein
VLTHIWRPKTSRTFTARPLLTFVLLGGAALSFALDWSRKHLLNPLWHAHARYHAAILLFLYAGVAGVGLRLLWRNSLEPRVAFSAASLISLSYWLPFFYVPLLLEPASYWAGVQGHEPRLAGHIVYPNLVVVGFFVLMTVTGWWMGRNAEAEILL